MFFILSHFFISHAIYATIVKHEMIGSHYKEFEYAEVCKIMGAKNAILISPPSLMEMECLNQRYQLIDFCVKKFPKEKTLTRGFVDLAKKKVLCEMSNSIMLSVSCDKLDSKYCSNPEFGCQQLRKIYAYRLDMAHYSILEENLNCYFTKNLEESLNEL